MIPSASPTSPAPRFSPARLDVGAVLGDVCDACQAEVLAALGIRSTLHVDRGELPDWMCELVARVLRALIMEICRGDIQMAVGGRIEVTLHRTGQLWVLGVRDKGIRKFDPAMPASRVSSVQGLAMPLGSSCRTRLMPDGAVTAVLFYAKPCWPENAPPHSPFSFSYRRAEPRMRPT
ncbi:MAG: histidine kinase [Rhodospirillaceae bacterium]